jgi:diadenylate cyclase
MLDGLSTPEYISHALDIIVVAYIIYRIIILIRGTHAVQMLGGLLLVALVYVLSQFFNMIMLQWLIDNFLNYIVLIIIVLFQQDIRRGLSQIGKSPFLARVESSREAQVIEEITRAAVTLATRRIGGLIVIERETVIRGLAEIGVLLDAAISREIIVSIFHTSSPIHDGAIIIQKGRIMAAGCFLPLTLNPDVPKELGTRHRAGIGITEDSDALTIVISEETGRISTAINGQLERIEEQGDLRQLLYDELRLHVKGWE